MRTRAVAVVMLLALSGLPLLSSSAGAQIVRLPRPGGRGSDPLAPGAAPLPPEASVIRRALAYKRSRWGFESYALLNSVQIPTGNGATTEQTFGIGTHGDYRYTDNFSFTVDATASALDGPSNSASIELGSRYALLPWDRVVRPFFDVRAAYMRSYDTFTLPGQALAVIGAPDFAVMSRYGRGFGAGAGAGLSIALTRSLALTTEMMALRSRMTVSSASTPAAIPIGSRYWLTTARYMIGFRYSPVRTAHLAQNPTH